MSTIYVNNLNEKVSINTLRNELNQAFKPYNPISIRLRKTLMTKGQAFISFPKSVDLNKIIKIYNNQKLLQKPMRVKIAKVKSYELLNEDEIKNIKDMKIWKNKGKPSDTLILTLNPVDDEVEDEEEVVTKVFESFEGFLNLRFIKSKRICFVEFENVETSKRCFNDIDVEVLKNYGKLSYAK